MKQIKIFILTILLASASVVSAQSTDYAKSLIQQGRYLDAAKVLRPLADGGNAEAQYMASQLFFEGKGVDKNETQSVKYATLAADQGYSDAVLFLAEYYFKNNAPQKSFSILNKYVNSSAGQQDSVAILGLGGSYIFGQGTEKDEDKGWALVYEYCPRKMFINEIKEKFDDYIGGFFWKKAKQAGKNSLEEYADYLYGQKKGSNVLNELLPYDYYTLQRYILDAVYRTEQVLKEKSDSGIPWAMSQRGNKLWYKGQHSEAMALFKKSAEAGSAHGRYSYDLYTRILAREQEKEWKNKLANIKVTTSMPGSLDARISSTEWKGGTLEIGLVVTTGLISRNLIMGALVVTGTDGKRVNNARVQLAGLRKQPGGQNRYTFTNKDMAILTISIPGMPAQGELKDIFVFIELSGSRNYVSIKNLVWK